MREIKNVLIIGLGAIGSIYATKIFDYDPDCIKVLLDKDRYQRYFENGIIFNNKQYKFYYLLESDIDFKADLIIIATKSTDFEQASDMIRNFVHENTIILSLLNGISSEEILFKKYERKNCLYSYFLGHSSMKRGANITFDGVGTIFFGEEENYQYSENVQAVKDFFDKANINYKIPEDMLSAIWQKFVINVGVNQTLSIAGMPYGGFNKSIVKKIAQCFMEEAVEIAKKLEIQNAENFIENTFKLIITMPPYLEPSMRQDINNGKTTEVDIFAGEICRMGLKYGTPTKYNQKALRIIQGIDEDTIKRQKSKEFLKVN